MVKPLVAGMGGRVKEGAAGLSDEVEAGASPWFWMRCCRRRSVAVSLFWRAALITGEGAVSGLRREQRAAGNGQRTVHDASLQVDLVSRLGAALLFADALEVVVDEGARVLYHRVRHLLQAGRHGDGAGGGRVGVGGGRAVRSGRDGGVRETLGPQQRQAGEVRAGG
jgi:hypothetical protein